MTPDTDTHRSSAALLRILSGAQQGAEVRLDDGDYLIGSDDECDIVLFDESIAGRHALLVSDNGELRIEAREQAVAIGDYRIEPATSGSLSLPVAIALGSIEIGIGLPGSDWSALALPLKTPAVTDIEAGEIQDTKAEQAPVQTAGAGNDGSAAKENDRQKETVKRRSSPWFIGIGMIIIIALLAGLSPRLSGWIENEMHLAPAEPAASALERTRSIIGELGLSGINVSIGSSSDSVVLNGYTAAETDKQRLQQALHSAGIAFVDHVWGEDWLERAARETLERLGADDLNADYQGTGVVRLSGYMKTQLDQQELQNVLRNDVPAITRVDLQVHGIDEVVAGLKQQLSDTGLADQVVLDTDGDRIDASGELNDEDMKIWRQLATAFAGKYGDLPALTSAVKLRSEPPPPPPEKAPEAPPAAQPVQPVQLSVIGIVSGIEGYAYAYLDDGNKIAEGDTLSGNYVIEKILIDRIIVRNGAQRFVYYVKEGI